MCLQCFRHGVLFESLFEAEISCDVEADDAFWFQKARRGLAPVGAEVSDGRFAGVRREDAAIQHRHERAAGGQHVLVFLDARVSGRYALRRLASQTPAGHVEQTPPLFGHSVFALDALPPPFTEVTTDTERHQFVAMRLRPRRESVVVLLWSYPACAAADEHLAIFSDADLRVRAVELFSDYAVAGQPSDFRKFHERT